jgi:hypothetical protein
MKKQQNKTVSAELPFTNVTFDRMDMIFFTEFVFFSLFAMHSDLYI